VERVWDRVLLLDVARKRLRLPIDAPEVLYRVKSEFRALRDISHPNLAQLFDLEVNGVEGFFTMELVGGVDYVSFVRRGGGPSEADCDGPVRWDAVRDAFASATAQLARGLGALHAAGKIHRDVKPSNVLVEPSGRVVLLDFGFVSDLRSRNGVATEIAGTFDYLAPETLNGEPPGPAADWFSLGVVIFEALTGRLPFPGSIPEQFLRKKAGRVDWPASIVQAMPAGLLDVLTRLLVPAPGMRATGEDLARELGAPATNGSWRLPAATQQGVFVGRGEILTQLERALRAVDEDGGARGVVVGGPSGMGKTELVERFVASAPATSTVLRSRCHLHEAVPFQALDAIVDELSRTLLGAAEDELPSVDGACVAAITQLFPVLLRVPSLRAADSQGLAAEAHARWRQGASALSTLLHWLARRGPLLLWIDDAQWGDRDSAQLLREALRARPAAPVLVLLTTRNEESSTFIDEVFLDDHCEVERIELKRLDSAETRTLATALLGVAQEPSPDQVDTIESIVVESAGVPFLAGEMARLASSQRQLAPSSVPLRWPRVGDVVHDRLQLVAGLSRDLLEIVAVAGRPMPVDLTCDLLASRGSARPLLPGLVNHSLVRRVRRSTTDVIEVYHDRIRETLLSEMSADVKQYWHRSLAEHYSRREPLDAQVLVVHWLGAGETERAATHAVPAASDAMSAMAFDRAAELFALAHRLRGESDADWELLERQGDALSAAGRAIEAGESFEHASAARGRAARDDVSQLTLRRRAGEQYLSGGSLHRGVQVLHDVLADLDVRMPKNAAAARRAALRSRIPALFSRRRAGDPSLVPPRRVQRLDALWAAAKGTLMLDFVLSDAMSARHLLEATRTGHPSHLVLALCMEAAVEANIGRPWLMRRSWRMLAEAASLATKTGAAYDEGWTHGARAAVSYYAENWSETLEEAERAVAIFSRHCIGVSWESTAVQTFLLAALSHLGRIRELQTRTAELLDDARARGDLLAQATVRTGHMILAPLAADEPDRALADAEAMLLPFTTDHYTSQHFHHVVATVQIHLYNGDGWRAWERITDAWPHLRKSGFLMLDCLGGQLRYLRGLAGLAARATEPPTGAPPAWTPGRLEREVAREARALERSNVPSAPFRAAVLRAELAGLRGDRATRRAKLHAARGGFDRLGMVLYRAAVDVALASDPRDEASKSAALDDLGAAGVRNPIALAGTLFPRSALAS